MSEKAGSIWLKAMAVTSAVALGGGYVAWKDAQAKNARIEALEKRVAAWEELDEEVTLFVGSKSPGPEVLNFPESGFGDFEQVEIPGIPSGTQLMPGSKSATIITPESEDEKAVRQMLIPSSKSIAPLLEMLEEEEKP